MRSLAVALTSVALLGGWADTAQGQVFLMNSAETINPGNFKVAGYPFVFLGEDDAENTWGTGGRIGIGLVNRFDLEGSVAVFSGVTVYGGDAELWLVNGPIDISVVVGGHYLDRDNGPGSKGLDLAGIVSAEVSPGVELIVGGSYSLVWIDEIDEDFDRYFVVPGAEVSLARDLDFIAEYGFALDDESSNYAAFGLAYYFR